MGPELQQALLIVVVGIGGVFVNLLALMAAITALGKVYGKKKPAAKARPVAKATAAGARPQPKSSRPKKEEPPADGAS